LALPPAFYRFKALLGGLLVLIVLGVLGAALWGPLGLGMVRGAIVCILCGLAGSKLAAEIALAGHRRGLPARTVYTALNLALLGAVAGLLSCLMPVGGSVTGLSEQAWRDARTELFVLGALGYLAGALVMETRRAFQRAGSRGASRKSPATPPQ
jgi:hypothetical protein